ncbi:MAG: 30S ribosomal protein S18, partial [Vulcanococcus sp.]
LSPIKPGEPIDYKDVDLLKKFITERGKILPRRLTGLTAKQQRDLTNAVKRARIMALLPFVNPEG